MGHSFAPFTLLLLLLRCLLLLWLLLLFQQSLVSKIPSGTLVAMSQHSHNPLTSVQHWRVDRGILVVFDECCSGRLEEIGNEIAKLCRFVLDLRVMQHMRWTVIGTASEEQLDFLLPSISFFKRDRIGGLTRMSSSSSGVSAMLNKRLEPPNSRTCLRAFRVILKISHVTDSIKSALTARMAISHPFRSVSM